MQLEITRRKRRKRRRSQSSQRQTTMEWNVILGVSCLLCTKIVYSRAILLSTHSEEAEWMWAEYFRFKIMENWEFYSFLRLSNVECNRNSGFRILFMISRKSGILAGAELSIPDERPYRRLVYCMATIPVPRRNISWLWCNSENNQIWIISAVFDCVAFTHINVECESMIDSLRDDNQITGNDFNANPIVVSTAIKNNWVANMNAMANVTQLRTYSLTSK